MKNITLSADDKLIEAARERARAKQHHTQRIISPLAGGLCAARTANRVCHGIDRGIALVSAHGRPQIHAGRNE